MGRRVLLCFLAICLTAIPYFALNAAAESNASTEFISQDSRISQAATSQCTARNGTEGLPCLHRIAGASQTYGKQVSEFFIYNASAGHLNNIQVVEGREGLVNGESFRPGLSLPTNEIYRTAHWIWFCDPTIYSQYKQDIDPFLDWPETSYVQLNGLP
jgi:hypothetical protein